MLVQSLTKPVSWIWLMLATLVGVTVLLRLEPLTALSIGLAAGLSLAGSM